MAFADTLRELLEGGPKKSVAAFAHLQKELRATPSLASALPSLDAVDAPDVRRHLARLHGLVARAALDEAAFARLLAASDDAVRAILVHELGNDRVARERFSRLARAELSHPHPDVRASAVYVFGQWAASGGDVHEAADALAGCLADHRTSGYHRAVVSGMAASTFRVAVRSSSHGAAFAQALDAVTATDPKTKARVRTARETPPPG